MTNVAILRETLELVLAKDDTFPKRFYEILFERHPETRAMFHRNTVGAQHKMFASKLTALVDHLGDPTWIGRELTTLSANHVSYGVTPEMYPWVGDALITTLRQACGEAWSDEAERAWGETYAAMTAAMLGTA